MNAIIPKYIRRAAILGTLLFSPAISAQTPGTVSLSAKISDTGSGPRHWTVVWVTDASSGAFVRTIRRQGPTYRSHWGDHCDAWYAAVAGDATRYTVAPDGFTSATAASYSAPNSPIIQTWDCTDANGATVPDGTYKLWIQYAEDANQPGPVTKNGLVWTKGAAADTVNPTDQGGDFTKMSIIWTPGKTPPPATGPEIAVEYPVRSNLVDGAAKRSLGTAAVSKKGAIKTFTIRNAGTETLTGLAITESGANQKDFIVTAPAKTSLAAGGKTTFKVTFKPTAKGVRTAAIHIKSNDADENPFDIDLAGQGGKKIKTPPDDDDDDDGDDD